MRTGVEHRVVVNRMLMLVALAAVAAMATIVLDAKPAKAAFPGDNGRIVFTKGGVGTDPEIYTMKKDGTDVRQLTNNSAWEGNPAFSPDGEKIAFDSNLDGTYEIFIMNSDGSNQRRVTYERGSATSPAFSPDGTRIVYEVWESGNADIHAINTDRSGREIIVQDSVREESPAWSPDGTEIAYVRDFPGRYAQLKIRDLSSGTERWIGGGGDPEDPNWSPDGNQLVLSMRIGSHGNYIHKINADGSGLQRLTSGSGKDFVPAFSPDGTKIAFTREVTPVAPRTQPEIYTMGANGGTEQRITNNPDINWGPDWQPRSNIILPPIIDIPFCTLWDCVKPTITSLRPATGSAIRDRTPTIRATVRDDRANLAGGDIKLYVDERRRTISYSRATDKLTYTSGRLAYGRHTVRIVATDGRNEATKS
ncbi:MAG: hypothetical protein WA982_10095, partial [Rubrobacteraceae bacterium]